MDKNIHVIEIQESQKKYVIREKFLNNCQNGLEINKQLKNM